MASSHGRFVDEVYCIPGPTASKIPVKTKNDLEDEIFPPNYFVEFRGGLYSAEEMNSRELFNAYPPKFKNENKQYIYEQMKKAHDFQPLPDQRMLITRWRPFIPYIESEQKVTEIKYDKNNFTYEMVNDGRTIDWYLNFADQDLFAFYAGSLLAQDELQVLECVHLASLREYLTQAENTVGTSTVGSDSKSGRPVPTPILICNAERVIELDTQNIYGNKFAKATHEELVKAAKRIVKPQTVNLIAMQAQKHGQGVYTYDQVYSMLATAYTAFKAAQILAKRAYDMNNLRVHPNRKRDDIHHLRTIIHTGWWGCGAFGNDRTMSLITQQLAARWAQVDAIVFHKVDSGDRPITERAHKFTDSMRTATDVKKVVEAILQLKLEWGTSDGT